MSVQTSDVITTSAGVTELRDHAFHAGRVGLDTEFIRERTYRPRLCLVQAATPDRVFIVDPLADVDLAPIAEVIADERVELLVHAGKQDLEIFYDRFGVIPSNVFDVQIAAAFGGIGSSLPYGRLVELTTGSKLTKGESYTDWCKRPLTEAQLSYAADDVRFLFAAADSLKQTLEGLGRALWVEQEMAGLETADAYRSDAADAWRKVGGRGSLSPAQMAVLQEVAAWRETEAQTRDLPRGWIMKDPTLIEVARRAPQSVTDLGRIRGLNEREVQRSASGLLEAVRKGKQAPAVQPGRGPGRAVQARARMIGGLADALVRARCEDASIAVESVATRADVDALLVDVLAGDLDESRHRLLEGWRRDLVGDAIVALARGRIALKTIDRPPYIEETAI